MPKQIPRPEILKLYQIKGMSAKEIARHFGVTRQAVDYHIKKAGIAIIDRRLAAQLPDAKLIEKLYVVDGLFIREIAERLNETSDRIRRAMRENGIPSRRRGGQPKYPQLRHLAIGESIRLPKETKHPHIGFYLKAKKAGIRVSVRTVDERTVKVTRKA